MKIQLVSRLLIIFFWTIPAVAAPTYEQSQPLINEVVAGYFPNLPKGHISVEPLTSAWASVNYLLQTKSARYVIRLSSLASTINGTMTTERLRREIYAMQEAEKYHIAPKIYFVTPGSTAVLMEYIDGETITERQANQPDYCIQIASSLRKLHSTQKNPYHGVSFYELLQQLYKKISYHPDFANQTNAAMQLLHTCCSELNSFSVDKVNIHGDLNPHNIFLTKKGIVFIDWEYTSWEDPFLDLSYLSITHSFTRNQEALLLESYLQHKPTHDELRRFQLCKKISYAGMTIICSYVSYSIQQLSNESLDMQRDTTKDWRYFAKELAKPYNPMRLSANFFSQLAKAMVYQAELE